MCANNIDTAFSDQRWYKFQNMGPSPSGRSGHAMASFQSKVFVLGGESFAPSKHDDLTHFLDTSEWLGLIVVNGALILIHPILEHIQYPEDNKGPPVSSVPPASQNTSRKPDGAEDDVCACGADL